MSVGGRGGGGKNGVKRVEVPALPKGWIREEVPRSGRINAGRKSDVHYISPSGIRVRSKPELIKVLSSDKSVDLSSFDYHSGTIINGSGIRTADSKTCSSGGSSGGSKLPGSSNGGSSSSNVAKKSKHYDFIRSLPTDNSLVPPIRQTASIFKQPVTVRKYQDEDENEDNEDKVKCDFKQSNAEKPHQLFWEKRLSGLRASYPEEYFEPFSLPSGLLPVGPGIQEDVILASIATVLHNGNCSIEGQTVSSKNLEKNPGVFIDPEQPLISGVVSVTEADLEEQEQRVNKVRKELEDALNSLTS